MQFLKAEPGCLRDREKNRVGVEAGAVLLARDVGHRRRRQRLQAGAEGAVVAGANLVLGGKLLGDEQTANSRHDGAQQDANGILSLIEQHVEQVERTRQVTRGNGIANLPDDAGTAHRHQLAHGLQAAAAALAQVKIDLLNLILQLTGVIAGHLHQQFQRAGFKSQTQLTRLFRRLPHDRLLPAGLAGVGLVVNLHLGELAQALESRATLVDAVGAEHEFDVGAETGLDHVEQVFKPLHRRLGAAGLAVAKKVRGTQPDNLGPAKKRHRLQRLDRARTDLPGMLGIVGIALNDLIGEIARVGRRQPAHHLHGRLLDSRIVAAQDDMNLAGGGGFLRRRHGRNTARCDGKASAPELTVPTDPRPLPRLITARHPKSASPASPALPLPAFPLT